MTDIALRDAFGQALCDLAESHPRLVVLDADVSSSCRTADFGKAHPDRFFNVGVAEANMVDVAAGLAMGGLRPVCSTFSLFMTLKAADQIRNTVCYNNLPVILGGGYGGLSDSFDGASHQSLVDLALMRSLPNMTVVVPGEAAAVRPALEYALEKSGPTYIRFSRNPTPCYADDSRSFRVGRIRRLREGGDLTIAVCGVVTNHALEACETLSREGVEVDLLEVHTLKPLDGETLAESLRRTGHVLTVEEHNVIGGLAGAVAEFASRNQPTPLASVGVQDTFTESGPYDELLTKYGISAEAIRAAARELLKK